MLMRVKPLPLSKVIFRFVVQFWMVIEFPETYPAKPPRKKPFGASA